MASMFCWIDEYACEISNSWELGILTDEIKLLKVVLIVEGIAVAILRELQILATSE